MNRNVERVLDLIECFTEDTTEIGVSELARMLGLPKATAFRIADTLEKRGYLVKDPKMRNYRVGHKFLRLRQGTWRGLRLF